jgi:hypothetical protein
MTPLLGLRDDDACVGAPEGRNPMRFDERRHCWRRSTAPSGRNTGWAATQGNALGFHLTPLRGCELMMMFA